MAMSQRTKEPKIRKPKKNKPFSCSLCGQHFSLERSLAIHICKPKNRLLIKDNKEVILGYQAWIDFHKLTFSTSKKFTYEEFSKSRFFDRFVRFGSFVLEFDVIDKDGYLKYLLNNKITISSWDKEPIYVGFIHDLVTREHPKTAIQRSIDYMGRWAELNQTDIISFFREVNTNIAVGLILNGRISPWVIMLCNDSYELIDRFDQSQMNMIEKFLNPAVWQVKLTRYKDHVKEIEILLKEKGL